MAVVRRIDFASIQNKILVRMHHWYVEKPIPFVDKKTIIELMEDEPSNAVADIIPQLETLGRIEKNNLSRIGGEYYRITRLGITFVENMPDEQYILYRNKILPKVPEPPTLENVDWSPIVVERLNEHRDDSLRLLSTAIEEIEGSNGYAASAPSERNGIISVIKAGFEALKKQVVSRFTVQNIIAPLQYLSHKFSDAAIGVAAKSAWEALVRLLA